MKQRGLRILARNYRCPSGEIDLICSDGDFLVFVEVKTLTSIEPKTPQEAVSPQQWRRIERAARHFLMRHGAHERPCRFDLAAVAWPTGGKPNVEHFEDAYQPKRL